MSPLATAHPKLIEGAVDQVIAIARSRLNGMIDLVQSEHQNGNVEEPITLEPVSPDRFYISEQVEPLRRPCVFVLDDITRMPLNLGQNITHSLHMVNVVLLVEDTTTARLVRKTWRYARAMYLAIHDQSTLSLNILVERFNYSPVFSRDSRDGRTFARDITLGVRLMHFENF